MDHGLELIQFYPGNRFKFDFYDFLISRKYWKSSFFSNFSYPGNIGNWIFPISQYPGNIGNLIFLYFGTPGNIGNLSLQHSPESWKYYPNPEPNPKPKPISLLGPGPGNSG